MATAGTVTIRLDGDSASLVRELNKAQKKTKSSFGAMKRQAGKMAKGLAIVGTAGAVALSVLVKSSFKSIDALAKLSDQLGVSTKALAGLQLAAKITGTDQNALNKALVKQQKAISDANRGLVTYSAQFEKLGINTEKLSRLSVDEQFMEIADALDKVENRTEQTAIAYDIWGGRATTLLNTIKGGRPALEAFADEAGRLGLAVSRVDAAQIEAANDAFTRTRSVVEGLGHQVAVAVAPFAAQLARDFVDAATAGEGFGLQVDGAMQVAFRAIGFVADGILGIQLSFKAVSAGALLLSGVVVQAFAIIAKTVDTLLITPILVAQQEVANAGASMARSLGMDELASGFVLMGDNATAARAKVAAFTDGAEEVAANMVGAAGALKDEIAARLNEPLPSEQVQAWADEAVRIGEETARKVAETQARPKLEPEDTTDPNAVASPDSVIGAWQLANEQRLEMDAALKETMFASEQEFGEQMITLAGEQARAKVQAELEAKGEALSEEGIALDPTVALEQERSIAEEKNNILKKSLDSRLKLEGNFGKNYKKLTSITTLFVGKAWTKQQAGTLKRTASFASAFQSIAGAMFGDSKIMAIANATISTLTGVAKALELPYPANIAAAAQVAATGFAQVSSIKGTSPGGGGATAPSVSGASAVATNAMIAEADEEGSNEGRGGSNVVQVFFEGPVIADDEATKQFIADTIREAVEDQDIVIINGDSRQAEEIRSGG